jgi:hypothetical protein
MCSARLRIEFGLLEVALGGSTIIRIMFFGSLLIRKSKSVVVAYILCHDRSVFASVLEKRSLSKVNRLAAWA